MNHMCIPLFWPSTMPYFSALSTFNNFSSLTLVAFFQGTHKMNYYTGPFLLLPGSLLCAKKSGFPTAKFYIVKATLMRAAWSSEWMSVEILPQQSKKVTPLVLCAIDVSSLKRPSLHSIIIRTHLPANYCCPTTWLMCFQWRTTIHIIDFLCQKSYHYILHFCVYHRKRWYI